MTRASDDRWEDGAGSIVASKASFAHARAVVNDQCCNFVVTHVGAGRLWLVCEKKKRNLKHVTQHLDVIEQNSRNYLKLFHNYYCTNVKAVMFKAFYSFWLRNTFQVVKCLCE